MSSAQPARRAWTYSDLVALPEDQLRHELIDGEHFVSPSPNTAHQTISGLLFMALSSYVVRHRTGKVAFTPGMAGNAYDVFPSGDRFLVLRPLPSPPLAPVTEISLVDHWFEELKAKVPGGQAK